MPDINPPPYSTLFPSPDSLFRLPSFDQVMAISDFEDSMRLPTYQARHLSRYHPYWRFRPIPVLRSEEDRYVNTIYDDEYIPLNVPPRMRRTASAFAPPPLVPQNLIHALAAPAVIPPHTPGTAPAHLPAIQNPRDRDLALREERWQRVYRLRAVIFDFLLAAKRAYETPPVGNAPAAAAVGDPVPVEPTVPDTARLTDTAVTDPDHAPRSDSPGI